MRKVTTASAFFLFVVILQVSLAQQIDVGTLLKEMVDRSKIAEFPEPAFQCKQFSSYNRETVAVGEEGWFANADSSFFEGYEDVDGRREWIMMDVEGPGSVVRWWLTQQKFDGTVRIYLDGSDEPIFAATSDKIVGGSAITGRPLSNVVGWNGRNLYMPIPFQKHCKITYDGPNANVTGKFPDCHYYNINYIKYSAETDVKTLTKDDLKKYSALIDQVQKKLLKPEENKLAVSRKADGGKKTLKSGKSLAKKIKGVGAISSLELKIDSDDIATAMRTTVISISFDGKEHALSTVGEFFGCGPGLNPFKGWWRQVQSDGWMKCWWPMPFKKNATVKIINYGETDISVELGKIGISDWKWTDKTMYFNTTWRSENNMKTTEPFDWNFVTIEGKGVYVGDTLALFNEAIQPHPRGTGTWWGEGDEKIFVDKEDFPSTIGTGTEDYYGYSWGVGGTFSAPFHSMPRGDANGNYTLPNHTTNTRVRSLDRIPFDTHLKLDMEVLHWQKTAVLDYAVTTHFYTVGTAEANGDLTSEKVQVKLGDPKVAATEAEAKAKAAKGALESK